MGQRRVATALLAAAFLAACGEDAPPALRLPDATSVVRIQASHPSAGSRALTAPEEIAAVVAALPGGAEWEATTANPDGEHHAVAFLAADNRIVLVLWIGDGWLMANDMQGGQNARRALSGAEREALLARLATAGSGG